MSEGVVQLDTTVDATPPVLYDAVVPNGEAAAARLATDGPDVFAAFEGAVAAHRHFGRETQPPRARPTSRQPASGD